MLTVFRVGFCNDYLVSCNKVLGKNTLSHWTYTMSSLSFSWSVEPKRPRPVNDHARDGRRETGGHSTLARACTPLPKSEEKERLLAVFSSFICGIKLKFILFCFQNTMIVCSLSPGHSQITVARQRKLSSRACQAKIQDGGRVARFEHFYSHVFFHRGK